MRIFRKHRGTATTGWRRDCPPFLRSLFLLSSCDSPPSGKKRTEEPSVALPVDHSRRSRPEKPPDAELRQLRDRLLAASPEEGKLLVSDLTVRLQAASASQIRDLLHEMDMADGGDSKFVAIAMLVLSTKNASDFIEIAVTLPPDSRALIYGASLRNLVSTDHNTVVRWLKEGARDSESAGILARHLTRSLVETHPETGLTLLSSPANDEESLLMIEGYRIWAAKDSRAALATALRDIRGKAQKAALDAIFEYGAKKDPAEAFRMVELIGEDLRKEAYWSVLNQWFDQDPGQAARAASGLDEETVLAYFSLNTESLGKLVSADPEAGLGILEKMKLDVGSEHVFGAAAVALAEKDPVKAIGWLTAFTGSPERDELLKGACIIWAEKDPENAERFIVTLDGSARTAALAGLAVGLAGSDPEASLGVVSGLPSADRSPYLSEFLGAMEGKRAADRAALIGDPAFNAEVLRSPEIAGRIQRISEDYALQSRDAARSWVEALDGYSRVPAVKGLMVGWMKSDIGGAAEWLGAMEAGAAKDAGILALIAEIESSDPESARKWRASLSEAGDK